MTVRDIENIFKIVVLIIILVLFSMWGFSYGDSEYTAVASGKIIMADRKMILELMEDARKQGGELNIAIFVFDDKKNVWNRARTLCGDK